MATVMEEVQHHEISPNLQENVSYIDDLVGIGVSWDILAKPFRFGNLNMVSYVTNGFFLTMNMVLILEDLQKCVVDFLQEHPEPGFTLNDLVKYLNTHVAFVQVQPVDKMTDVVRFILSGPMITFIDGYDKALMIDTRIYPMRSITEPFTERVVRGNHDGFTETMLMNTSLIRRRLRDPRLRVELMQVGTRGQTDVSLMYLKDVADDKLVEKMKQHIQSIRPEGMMMGEQQMIDLIGKVKWNPFPIARYSERPDVAATALLEGQIVIVVDTTASVIIAPTTFFQHLQHPQEYHSYPLIGTYLRWTILLAMLAGILLPGIFVLMNVHPHWVPEWLSFFKAEKNDPLPLWVEILIAEILLDLLRLAVLNIPSQLAAAVSIVSALLFGQFASTIKLLQPEVLVYMGVVMMATYATPSFELAIANQLARLWILVWTGPLGLIGFVVGVVSVFVLLVTTKSFGVPYLWPLIPFKWSRGMKDVLLRLPTAELNGVPSILRSRKRSR